ncbi:MAG: biopolymer transporter ExbD [Campylobacterales bacterium]|nr:biopolymer transporter ExbD [Campylobacterales bacterium]
MLDYEDKPELNITPLVDVMLVLLAILMLAMPAIVYQEKIELPKGSKSSQISETEKISVRVDVNKTIYVNDRKFQFEGFGDSFLNYSAAINKETPITLRADKNLKYDDVMFVMKSLKLSGFQKISLVTDG